MTKSNSVAEDLQPPVAIRICLTGCVQGAGVRPAIARLATTLQLKGSVRNTMAGLEIEVEGTPEQIATFQQRIPISLPRGCTVKNTESTGIARPYRTRFSIERDDATGPLTTQIPPDIAACEDCLAEVRDPSDRRYLYPLTTCAACGPRVSLIRQMPFDRARTTMDRFPLCAECRGEYESPDHRRFHAQTIGCHQCGPRVWLANSRGHELETGAATIRTAANWLRDGKIVALRGVGGYQLLCDATRGDVVERLRLRKARPAKPFAVMVASIQDAAQHAVITELEREALTDRSNPIVLLRSKSPTIAEAVYPGLHTLGLMLPTTPLHALLCADVARPLVCTSANREGEPLEHDIQAAQQNLAGIADIWLHHDRPIALPIDDSVVQVIAGQRVTLRLGRGLAPLPLALPRAMPQIALGGQLKSAIAWHNGSQAALGPHLGDLDSVATRERFERHLADIRALYRFEAESVAHDLHPDYFTTQYAGHRGIERQAVQHHLAHIAAGMLEHELLDRTVLGVSWDGTGFGDDGMIWGGEFLLVDAAARCQRVAHLRPFPWTGGDALIRQPWRAAIAMLCESMSGDHWLQQAEAIWSNQPVASLVRLNRSGMNTLLSSSVGRLFDAVAAIVLGIDVVQYEGQAAMRLEASATLDPVESYSFSLESDQLDWRPMIRAIWQDRIQGIAPAVISARFHRGLAAGIQQIASRFPGIPIVFSGGVFQNRLLTEWTVSSLIGDRQLKLPGRIPSNDGGLAAGQLAVAVMRQRAG